jgi:3-oxoacyl-[acyl-carrier protein] reductase
MSERPVALVTGGATGIGAACCRALAADGFRVAIHYRSSADAAQRLAAALPEALAIAADLAAPAEIDSLIERLRSATGRVDVLVNNAGLNRNADTVTMKLDDYDEVASVARGTWYLTKLVLRRFMIRAGRGRIITITSVVGHTGNRGQVPYTMVKAGLDAMTKSLAHELRGRGILVNAVAPGFIDTEMTAKIPPELRAPMLAAVPLERMGTPEEVADVVSFLATRGSYIHGSTIHVNGGLYGG